MSKFIVSQQSNIKILNGVVNSKILNSVSKVLKYGSDAWGYQRDQKPEHIKSILEYIKLNKENCLFTNSIILAMDEQNFKIDASVNDIIDFDLNLNLGLRIVDGQHRLAAIKNSIYDFDLNVIILIIPEGERTRELEYALGSSIKKVEDNEKETCILQRRCLRASRDLVQNELITSDMIQVLRPAPQGSILPYEIDDIIGKRLNNNIVQGSEFKWSDIK